MQQRLPQTGTTRLDITPILLLTLNNKLLNINQLTLKTSELTFADKKENNNNNKNSRVFIYNPSSSTLLPQLNQNTVIF